VREHVFRALYPFGGLGGGALGQGRCGARILGQHGRIEVLGGIDFEQLACQDFEYLAKAPAWCMDVLGITAHDLRQRYGAVAPDFVFLSPPCKGASGLLSSAKAETAKYQAMNQLALVWMRVMLEAWGERPPKFILLENVPRLKQRAPEMLREIRKLLKAAGYVFTDGFHECGEIGGLAQIRRRYLLVARHAKQVPPLLFQPPKKRVRACGEVLGQLPLPGDPTAGPMHALPRLSWLNWVRLALIPAGGDWRDLEGVLRDGQARREVFKRHHVQDWAKPTATVAGSGSNGPSAVADPRLSFTCNENAHRNKFAVAEWDEPAPAVIGATRPGSGAPTVADPRVEQLRIKTGFDHAYGVLDWQRESSPTIAGGSHPGQGAYSVADLRFRGEYYNGTYGVMSWAEAAGTITGNTRPDTGRFVVADPRKPPDHLPVIIAADGTWHRPITTLECAALQSIPAVVDGAPLKLHGKSISGWRERIGNAVPPDAAEAIGYRILFALLEAAMGGFSLASPDTPVWISPDGHHDSEPVSLGSCYVQ
jgi:site-specific DNA-cytosine methylase